MTSKNQINLLLNKTLTISQVEEWLDSEKNIFKKAIQESNCNKWNKWLEDKSTHIYPCVCPTRVEDCIFIETYYELEKVLYLNKKEDYFKNLILEYKQLQNDKKTIKEWVKKLEDIGSNLFFKSILEIKLESEPLKYLKLQINENEFQNLIEFQKLFDNTYYTEDYQTITNQ